MKIGFGCPTFDPVAVRAGRTSTWALAVEASPQGGGIWGRQVREPIHCQFHKVKREVEKTILDERRSELRAAASGISCVDVGRRVVAVAGGLGIIESPRESDEGGEMADDYTPEMWSSTSGEIRARVQVLYKAVCGRPRATP